jgi:hypothetical protein
MTEAAAINAFDERRDQPRYSVHARPDTSRNSPSVDEPTKDLGVTSAGVVALCAARVHDQVEPDHVLPDQVEPDHVDPDHVLPDQVEPDHVLPDQVEPDHVLPDQVEPDHVDPDQVLPDQELPVQFDSGQRSPDHVSVPVQVVPASLAATHAAGSQRAPVTVCSPIRRSSPMPMWSVPREASSDPSPVAGAQVWGTGSSLRFMAAVRSMTP